MLMCMYLLAIALVAQDIPPDEIFWGSRPYVPEIANAPAIRVQSDLVEVATVVRDSHEKPVGNLKKEDFLLSDNGKPQIITAFSIQRGTESAMTSAPNVSPGAASSTLPLEPRYVAMFFDDANTSMPNINFAREEAIKFIEKGLDPSERVGIFTASGTLTLDFTDDVRSCSILWQSFAYLRECEISRWELAHRWAHIRRGLSIIPAGGPKSYDLRRPLRQLVVA